MKSSYQSRLLCIALFLFALFSVIVVQFFKVQIIEGEKWTKQALSQHQMVVNDPAKRGIFYSNVDIKEGHINTPQPLIIDVPKYHLFIDPLAIPQEHRDFIAQKLFDQFSFSEEQREKSYAHFLKKARSRKLLTWISRKEKEEVEAWWKSYYRKAKIPSNAIYFIQDYQRSYPFGSLLGSVLHTIREDREGKEEKAIPTGGLELFFNSFLSGKNGQRLLIRSPRHRLDTKKVIVEPENGADVYLTINHHLQAIAEEELRIGVKKAKAKGGWAIMIDPFTGEIYALAQYPTFDPSNYKKFFNDPLLEEHTKVKAVTDCYEPGSVMKPIIYAIGLKANVFDPLEKTPTSNSQFPGRSKPLKDLRFHKYLNLKMALQKSSNIYPAQVVQKIIEKYGEHWFRQQLQNTFGFGLKTHIELPSESEGLLPRPGKTYPNGTLEWSAPTPYSLAMGHNLMVNSMQMIRAFSVFANGGYLITPTLIKKIAVGNEILLDNRLKKRMKGCKQVLDPEIVSTIVDGLKLTTKPGGTAPRSEIYGYTEAGKTGTSEKIINGRYCKNCHISTFIGFTPVEYPRFVLMVTIDEPEYRFIPGVGKAHMGGACAAPVFSEIAARSLRYLGVEPDDPHGYPPSDPRYDREKADTLPELDRLKALYTEWNQ